MLKKQISKGVLRHMIGGAGAGIVGYALGQGFTLEQVKDVLDWVEFAGGLLLLFAASGMSALDKLPSKKGQTKTTKKKRSKLNE